MPERRIGGFAHLLQALDYAAKVPGQQLCWFDGQGREQQVLSYAQLLELTRRYAAQLTPHLQSANGVNSTGMDQQPGPRIGIVAITRPDFIAAFCASQSVGAIPCPLPAPAALQDLARYAQSLSHMCEAAGIGLLLGPQALLQRLQEEAPLSVNRLAFEDLARLAGDATAPAAASAMNLTAPTALAADAIAYVQFSSGSTGQPKAIAISHAALMHNVDAILQAGMAIGPADRAFSWLPYYHDMGLVGFVLAPLCAQVSVDYLAPSAFARRPHLWPSLMAERGTTITYAPNFAWQMAAQSAHLLPPDARLQALRIAGVGGDYVDYAALQAFAQAFAPHGFDANAFKPSYGLAEATLAVSMSSAPFTQLCAHYQLGDTQHVQQKTAQDPDAKAMVECGKLLPGWRLEVRNTAGQALPAHVEGELWLQGPAQRTGYFSAGLLQTEPASAGIATGDKGFLNAQGTLYVSGRSKDMLVIHGRNVWPLDVEAAASEHAGLPQEHLQLLQSQPTADRSPNLLLLVHEKAARQSPKPDALQLAAAAATAVAGAHVRTCVVPNGSIGMTSSGKKARAATQARFDKGQIPILSDSHPPSESDRLAKV